MAYEINYEEKQLGIIKKSIPILIQQIKNGNPFRPKFQESQMNYRFFRKSVYNMWNIITDEDLDMEYEDEAVWADMFVDYLMDINNKNNNSVSTMGQKKQPAEQNQQPTGDLNSVMQKSEQDLKSTEAGNTIGLHKESMQSSMEDPNINEIKTFINFATTNGFLDMDSELIETPLTTKDLNAAEVKAEMNITEMNKAEMDKAEMNITEMNKAEMNRAEVKITEMKKAEMNITEMNKAEMRITEMNITEMNKAEMNRAEVKITEMNKAEMNITEMSITEKNKAELKITEMSITKMNKAEINKAEMNKAEMNKAEMSKVEMNKAEMNRAEVKITEMNTTEMNITEMNEAEMNIAEMNITEVNMTRETRKKWTLTRIFGIIFPCLRPKTE